MLAWVAAVLLLITCAACVTGAVCVVLVYLRLKGVNLEHVDFELRNRRVERANVRVRPYGKG